MFSFWKSGYRKGKYNNAARLWVNAVKQEEFENIFRQVRTCDGQLLQFLTELVHILMSDMIFGNIGVKR
tara:strand:+ start:603 stop:809 length:207 start_codon:yes stop_codon:yes gene_type:complete